MHFCNCDVVNSINYYTEHSPYFGVMCYDLQGICDTLKYNNITDFNNKKPLNTLVWISVDKNNININQTHCVFLLLHNELITIKSKEKIRHLIINNPNILYSIVRYCEKPTNIEDIKLNECEVVTYIFNCCKNKLI